MHRVTYRLLSLGLATAMVTSGLAVTTAVVVGSSVAPVQAADAPWTLPTVPPKCTQTQINSGNVASCVVLASSSLPESYGWPTPPFPEAVPATVIPWVDLAKGASGMVVTRVQTALNAHGAGRKSFV